MWKWLKAAVAFVAIAYVSYGIYDGYRAGYFTRPPMPEGAFSLSYKNGLRGILVGIPEEKSTRRYLAHALEVPFYLEDAWSFCYPPTEEEQQYMSAFMKIEDWPGARFEAICRIEVDNDIVVRGLIASVPKL